MLRKWLNQAFNKRESDGIEPATGHRCFLEEIPAPPQYAFANHLLPLDYNVISTVHTTGFMNTRVRHKPFWKPNLCEKRCLFLRSGTIGSTEGIPDGVRNELALCSLLRIRMSMGWAGNTPLKSVCFLASSSLAGFKCCFLMQTHMAVARIAYKHARVSLFLL